MKTGGRLHWIDFQDARLGPATYDLASLLRDSYVELDEDFVAARVREFRDAAAPDEEPASFLRRFELMCVQRNLKALGTFGFQAATRVNPVYIQYIPRTLAYVRANLERHARFGRLRGLLADALQELR